MSTRPTHIAESWRAAARDRRAQLLVLVDPDKSDPASLPAFVRAAEVQGVDGFLVGGSLALTAHLDACIGAMTATTALPVVLFPGGVHQISGAADAILFLSVVTSRNPDLLIGQHVIGAPIVRALGLEPISTAYMLVASDVVSTAEYMSFSKPLPRAKVDLAVAHAMAAEAIGMSFVYLEGGSGAAQSVPDAMVAAVSRSVSLPLIVGGGIRTPGDAAAKVRAGASLIVVGTHFEDPAHIDGIAAFARAVHEAAA